MTVISPVVDFFWINIKTVIQNNSLAGNIHVIKSPLFFFSGCGREGGGRREERRGGRRRGGNIPCNSLAVALNLPCATSHSNASKLDAVFVDQCFVQCLLAWREEKRRASRREEKRKKRKRKNKSKSKSKRRSKRKRKRKRREKNKGKDKRMEREQEREREPSFTRDQRDAPPRENNTTHNTQHTTQHNTPHTQHTYNHHTHHTTTHHHNTPPQHTTTTHNTQHTTHNTPHHTPDNRLWSWECLRQEKSECLDTCTIDNRPWSWDEKVNTWICAPRPWTYTRWKHLIYVTSVIFMRIYCFRINLIFTSVIIFAGMVPCVSQIFGGPSLRLGIPIERLSIPPRSRKSHRLTGKVGISTAYWFSILKIYWIIHTIHFAILVSCL